MDRRNSMKFCPGSPAARREGGHGHRRANAAVCALLMFGLMGSADQALASGALRSKTVPPGSGQSVKTSPDTQVRVTFVELGSVKCVPCKMMQPIMDEIAKEYADQVKVVFYDVWTPEGRPYAEQYRIHGIPTQVFLDKDGKEFFRHVGFFPKAELVKVLQSQGVK